MEQGRENSKWPYKWPYGQLRAQTQAPWLRRLTPLVIGFSLIALVICAAGPLGQRARAWAMESPFPTRTANGATASLSPTRDPATEVTPTPISPIAATVESYLSQMSLDEKLGQLIMVETYSQSYSGDIKTMVEQQHAGALIIYAKNMTSPDQLRALTRDTQAHTSIPMFFTMDEEGGNVDRLGNLGFAPPLPSAKYLGSTGNPGLAFDAGSRAAAELKSFGINVDLAPVADVRTIPNPVIGPRPYGSTAATVDAFAGAFLDGLQQNGIIGTLKHWPGIGSVALDPHKTLPTVTRSRAELEATDFATFRDLLAKSPGMIMVTHVLVNAIDPDMPSSLSPKLVQGILRDQMGYQGVIITDNLWMKGVSLRYSLPEAAVLAVLAGNDLLEGPWNPATMRDVLNGLRSAVNSGRISQQRIDESVRRILTLKAQYGILPLRQGAANGANAQTLDGASQSLAASDRPRAMLSVR
jgi:beta-N-acetylhexosaminidase